MTDPFQMPGLPKWPCCEIRGAPITMEQAMQIIIRTQCLYYLSGNDKHWEEVVKECFGLPMDNWFGEKDEEKRKAEAKASREAYRRVSQEIQPLDINYLHNDNIISSYIGGPNGWCRWDGKISQTGKNIGKWPSCETVLEEWETIAEAFPFLSLTCQLFDREQCEEGAVPVIEYVVRNGVVNYGAPRATMEIHDADMTSNMLGIFTNPSRERGCTIEMLEKAIALTKEAVRAQSESS